MDKPENHSLAAHFFRTEYGRLISVVIKHLGINHFDSAEDIVQETLLKAISSWQLKGIPPNPQAWLYTTAKNLTLNFLKKQRTQAEHNIKVKQLDDEYYTLGDIEFSEQIIEDEQLKMMFVCCHPQLSENAQIALILKTLCGFSIAEIANAFFTTTETINKRLVRARKYLSKKHDLFDIPLNIDGRLDSIYKTLYLLFSEGYKPSEANKLIRFELCIEAIRLVEILINNKNVTDKSNGYALASLMYLNSSRFEARINDDGIPIEMSRQDRTKWDREFIDKGLSYLDKINKHTTVTTYHILAAISANHCIAPDIENTNWKEILALYDRLLLIDDSPIVHLNRSVALAKVKGNVAAIKQLKELELKSDIGSNYIFHSTLAEFYGEEKEIDKALERLKIAISLTKHKPDELFLKKKLEKIVPVSYS